MSLIPDPMSGNPYDLDEWDVWYDCDDFQEDT